MFFIAHHLQEETVAQLRSELADAAASEAAARGALACSGGFIADNAGAMDAVIADAAALRADVRSLVRTCARATCFVQHKRTSLRHEQATVVCAAGFMNAGADALLLFGFCSIHLASCPRCCCARAVRRLMSGGPERCTPRAERAGRGHHLAAE
jgi:hypothetical protein